jgi:CheY-like chemotaxis protein
MGSRVLVVDDDPWILRMVTATLEKKKYVVDTAREGRQALERAQSKRPDVIITDIMMPVMDGWTFVQHLRADPRLAGTPVIFLTALSREEAKLAQMGLSPDDYLAKPFRFDDLETRVSKAIARGPAHVSGLFVPPDESGVFGGKDSGIYEAVEEIEAEPEPEEGAPHPTPERISFTPLPSFSEPDPEPVEKRRHPTPPPKSNSLPPTPPQPPSSGSAPSVPTGMPPGYYPPGYAGYGQQPGYPSGYSGGYPPGFPPGYPGYPPQQGYPPGYPQQGGYPPAGYPPGFPVPGAPPGGAPVPGAPNAEAKDEEADKKTVPKRPTTGVPRRPTALNGRLEQLGLSSLLVMMEMERKDGVLTLKESDDSGTGRIFLRGGQVICAKFDNDADRDGKECVYEMLAWKKGTFSFNATEVDMEDTINSSTTHLLMEGARLMDEAARDTI